ncbi:MAG: hypothetical protein J7K13_01490 [Thermoplasmata archaeon]|nr:hypothetical protein [Thermoplasmata archaeon]
MKHGRPYFFKASNTSKKRKKPSAKKGHKAHFRPMPENIDEVWHIPVHVCPDCGSMDLSENVQEIRERVYEEIPSCDPVAVKLLIERRYCRHCKKTCGGSGGLGASWCSYLVFVPCLLLYGLRFIYE